MGREGIGEAGITVDGTNNGDAGGDRRSKERERENVKKRDEKEEREREENVHGRISLVGIRNQ